MAEKVRKFFGTDGIRGPVNQYPLTAEFALRLGRSLAFYLKQSEPEVKVVVGRDTRRSGDLLEGALVAGLLAQGADVIRVGVLPTPGVAFWTVAQKAQAGVVISASHNPFHDNGLKIFGKNGFKLEDKVEETLEFYLNHNILDSQLPPAAQVGAAHTLPDPVGGYVEYLKNSLPLTGLTIVIDCAHGAAFKAAPQLLSELGATVHLIGAEPNGLNINDGVGSIHPEFCAQKVLETKADLGLALDGDADRAIFIDHLGRVVPGDQIMYLCALHLKKQGRLAQNTMVATVMSNMGLEIALQKKGIGLVRTPVGDRHVVECLREKSLNFGGESSGHLIFLDNSTTGDGLRAALEVLAAIKEAPLADLTTQWQLLPQILLNLTVPKPKEAENNENIKKQVAKISAILNGRGRILLRPSGTEPLLRLMLEGDNEAEIKSLATETAALIQKEMSA